MGKTKDFDYQSSAVSTPAASTAAYYVDTSGVLKFVNPAGAVYFSNTSYHSITPLANVDIATTGTVLFQSNVGYATGRVYGTSGNYTLAAVLGTPTMWLPVSGPSGTLLCIPAYSR